MSNTTTARAGQAGTPRRAAAPPRRASTPGRSGAAGRSGRGTGYGYGSYVDGTNALQIGYADPVEVDDPVDYAPPTRRARPRPAQVPRPRSRPTQRPESTPAAKPAAAPLPVALPRAPFLILVVFIVVAGVLGVLVLNTKINENAFELDNLRAQQDALNLQEQQLNQQLADKESTGNLAAEAARLGLVPAGTPAFLSLPNGQVLGVPQPAHQQATTSDPGR